MTIYVCILFFFIATASLHALFVFFFFFQAEDGIRDLVRFRGLGDVYKRQPKDREVEAAKARARSAERYGRTG